MLEIVMEGGEREDYKVTDIGPFRIIEFDCLMCNVANALCDERYLALNELNTEMWRKTRRTMSLDLHRIDEGIIVITKNHTVMLDPEVEKAWSLDWVKDRVIKILGFPEYYELQDKS